MTVIIRSIHNTTSKDITLFVPGYNPSNLYAIVPANTMVDLFTLVTGDELQSMQGLLEQYVAAGEFGVTATVDTATFNPIGGGSLASLAWPIQNADIGGFANDSSGGAELFVVTGVIDDTHLTVLGPGIGYGILNPGDTIVQGSNSTTITSITDATHLVVGSTIDWQASIPLFTATKTGIYQINMYSTATGTDAGITNPTLYLGYTDDAGVQVGVGNIWQSGSNPIVQLTPGSVGQGVATIEVVAGNSVYYGVFGGSYDAGSTYSFYISATQL